jgi:hypothetical protein
MPSEAKIAANRRNAQRSTGPRTAVAKARVRRNALKHGLAALTLNDSGATAEQERLAAAIRSPEADALEREQASIIAGAQITLKQIRKMRTEIMEAPESASSVAQLLRLERYEDRARAQIKRACSL